MRIKLLYPPRAHSAGVKGPPHSRIPCLGLPILKSLLERHGFRTDIDDLDIKVSVGKGVRRQGIDMGPFLDRARVKRFIGGGGDEVLEEQASRLLALTKTAGYDIIGFSLTDEWNFSCQASTLVLSKVLRERTGSFLIAGGADICCLWSNFTEKELQSCTDLISFEPPLVSPWRILELAKALTGEKRKPQSGHYVKGGRITDNYGKCTPPLLFSKRLASLRQGFAQYPHCEPGIRLIDCIDLPDFRGLPIELYTYLPDDIRENFGIRRGILVLPYLFSINCPSGCIFCGNSMGRKGFASFDPATIADHLAILRRRHHTRYFRFMNNNINPTKGFTRRLIKELRGRDLNLMVSDCANFRELDATLLEGLHAIGVRRLIYGIESPNDKMLQYLRKGIRLAHAKRILVEADRAGIWNEVEVICGLPFETLAMEEQALTFLRELSTVINFYWVHRFKLLHSEMRAHPKKYGLANLREPAESDVQGWAFDEIGGLSWAEKYGQIKRSYQRAFELAESLGRTTGYSGDDESFIRMFMLYTLLDKKREVHSYMRTHAVSKD